MSQPRFTIILPSYNGGAMLRDCVEKVLSQTYSNLSLVVLDDCSSDGSLEWLQAQEDPRLSVVPSPQRLGIVGNWSRALQVPKGEFMTILGQDDYYDPNYLQVIDQLIHRHPTATLYHAHFRFIDEHGNARRSCRSLPEMETAAEYITELFSFRRDTYGTGYVMRSALYEELGGIPPFPKLLFADDALWISAMRRGYKATASNECFACRVHDQSTSASAHWRPWLEGMREYARFLAQVAREDAEFSTALRNNGFSYFLNVFLNKYTEALVEATKANRLMDSQVKDEVLQPLSVLFPEMESAIAAQRSVRMREFFNKNAVARWAYSRYIQLRYGSHSKMSATATTRNSRL